MSKMVTMDVFKLSQNLKFKYRDKRELEDLRGMCGHIVHLRIRMKTCLKLACFCPKLFSKDKKPINMRFYVFIL